jgi:DNA primase catalytic subunit
LNKKSLGTNSNKKMEQYGRQTVAGLIMDVDSQKHCYVSRCCDRSFSKKMQTLPQQQY